MAYKLLTIGILSIAYLYIPHFSKAFAQEIITEFGPVETVYDWSTQKCQDEDIPDFPARALVDASGNVQLYSNTALPNRKSAGPNLTDQTHDCHVIMSSHLDPVVRNYNTTEFIVSPYTLDGNTIYGLVHTEYHGNEFNNCHCPIGDYACQNSNCWWTSVNLATSTNQGATYTHSAPPSHNIANSSIDYNPNNTLGPVGFFEPSNIVHKDGYFYSLIHKFTPRVPAQTNDNINCLMRTNNLSDPNSWRLWDGSGFSISTKGLPATGDCKSLNIFSNFDLSYNSYLGQYITASSSFGYDAFYHVSSNLTNWNQGVLFTWPYNKKALYLSFLQPGDPTRNFEQSSRSPWMYFVTCGDTTDCTNGFTNYNRDLKRVRVRFSKPEDVGKYEQIDLQFNEYKGTKTLDSGFYGNDGSLSNVQFLQESTHNFVRFNGTSLITVPHNTSLNATQALSIRTRIRTTMKPPTGTFPIIATKSSATRNFGLYLTAEGKIHFSIMQGTNLAGSMSTTSINDGKWHDIEIAFDNTSGNATYYIDGALDAEVHQGGNLDQGINNGSLILGGSGFVGDIDAFTLLNYRSTSHLPGDLNTDGNIDTLDYLFWKNVYPQSMNGKNYMLWATSIQ